MSTKANHIKIGVFVLVAIGLFIAGLIAFGARGYFAQKTMFETAIVDEVAGLSVGSVVLFRGVPVGKVTKIAFAWSQYPESQSRHIIVEFEVEGILIPLPPGFDIDDAVKQATENGLRAVVRSQGITGTSRLELERLVNAAAPPEIDYTPRYVYIPSAPSQFTRMLDAIDKILESFRRFDIAAIGQDFTNTMSGMNQFLGKLNAVDLQSVATNAEATLVEIRTAAITAEAMVAQMRLTISGMRLTNVTHDAGGLITGLRDTNDRFQALLAKLNTLPMQDTVTDLKQAVMMLNEVLLELKSYPSGFFLGEPPPPVKGMRSGR